MVLTGQQLCMAVGHKPLPDKRQNAILSDKFRPFIGPGDADQIHIGSGSVTDGAFRHRLVGVQLL